ncbi:MFS transporter [Xenorhabdus sp. 12]|uniref:MFS transporter n=1 Tax=Xenorhabdus santafensis TaxID=2582833 RepID=A0ABU4SBH5_9GAMM|nr:MFS transporter [Xenorhabdus sp. 12]MDX7988115.1 MFS transporter [Xenorhabdus sp. 12]
MPLVVYILGVTIFSITTSEFMVAGMMPSLTEALGISVAQVGYLISLYATGMVIGGPVLTTILLKLRVSNKNALLWLLVFYAIAQSCAASSDTYEVMSMARIATGVAGAACFGMALAICGDVVDSNSRGRAASIVVAGMMLATVLGVPIATMVDQYINWRASFWLVVILTLLSALLITALVPKAKKDEEVSLTTELEEFGNKHLWAAYATSGLIIGATFAAFSYFAPILIQVSGFSTSSIPWIIGAYGIANVIGNSIAGRFADRHTMSILFFGLIFLGIALALLASWMTNQTLTLILVLVIGFVGIPMNPAMIARVMKTAKHAGPLVNTVHTSIINIGLGVGSWLGGFGIVAGHGLTSPLWVGVGLAVLGLLSLLPYFNRTKQALVFGGQ